MKAPEKFRGMKLVKCYEKYALYTNGKWNECFTYYDLGHRTIQVQDRKVNVDLHL